MTTTNRKPFRLAARAALAGATLLALVAGSTARASDVSKEERMPRTYAALMKMKPVEVMHMMDKENRGYVTRDEFMKFYERVFEQLDRDKNGRVTEPEFTDRG